MTQLLTDAGPIDVNQMPPEWYDMIYSTEDTGNLSGKANYTIFMRKCAQKYPSMKGSLIWVVAQANLTS
jgi:hypothetical protein